MNLTNDEIKAALKEALKEWLDDRVKAWGYLSIRTLGVALFGAVMYFILTAQGWHK